MINGRVRLDAGQVSSPRELENLQSEIESLLRRQSDLEDAELEVMERLESAQARLNAVILGQPVSVPVLGLVALAVVLALATAVLWLLRSAFRDG